MFYGHVYSRIQYKHRKHIKHSHENRNTPMFHKKNTFVLTKKRKTVQNKTDLDKITTTTHINEVYISFYEIKCVVVVILTKFVILHSFPYFHETCVCFL